MNTIDQLNIFQEIKDQNKRGVLLILTGPSGAGKDTVIARLMEKHPEIIKIVTTTSRSMRENESEGKPYHFISREEFEERIAEGAFFEWVEFRGELYGTEKKTLLEALNKGVTVIWKIETKGVKNIKEKIKQMVPRVAFVFLTAESIDAMRERVYQDEGADGAKKRWHEPLVVWEMRQFTDCDYLVVNKNSNLDSAVEQIESILEAKRLEIIKEHHSTA